MRVALVFPPYAHKIFSENLSTVDEEFCLAPPIILAYVAAILEKHGHKVKLVDARSLNLSKEETLQRIKDFRPDILGFRAETYHFHDALEWIGYLKSNLGVPVLSGGVNLSLYSKETMFHKEIDFGIIGEAVETLPVFLSALENEESLKDIPGIAYKTGDETVVINPPSEQQIDFNSYPFPARHLLPNDKYYSFISQKKNFTIMLASMGCPFKCSFCAIPSAYKARTPKNVVDEMEVCYKDFNVREIDFFDAVFFLHKPRALEIFREIKRRGLRIEWSCRTRVDVVDEEILRDAARAGCRQIYYGIESVEPKILKSINKDISSEQARQAIRWSKRYGIRTMGFFMVGNPGDTVETVRSSIEFAKRLGLDFIQVCRTIPKPGSELDKTMIEETGRDYWREHIQGKKIRERLPAPWSRLTELEKESLTKEFYLQFYMRPRVVWSRVSQLKSLKELGRYIRVGWRMFLQKSEACSHILTDTSEAEKLLLESRKYLAAAKKAKTAIVIPTYNEKDNIKQIISAICEVLPEADIVIVDDNSPDGTGLIADQLSKKGNIHVIHLAKRQGLGPSYIEGFKFAFDMLDSDYIFEMDADLSHNPQYIPIFLHYAQTYEIVTGSRFLRRVSIKNRPLWRNIISKTTKWFVNIATGIGLSDVTTGFKCFQRPLLERIDFDMIKSKGYAFQIEVSYAAKKLGADIKEMPILFVERTTGKSKMSAGIMLEGICLVLKLSLRRFRGYFQKINSC